MQLPSIILQKSTNRYLSKTPSKGRVRNNFYFSFGSDTLCGELSKFYTPFCDFLMVIALQSILSKDFLRKPMFTQKLNRQAYIDSVMEMSHFATLRFAKEALEWWDSYYDWGREPCVVLYEGEEAVCYLFYHISKNQEYLTIHNLFTPYPHRFHGYAKAMLKILFEGLKPFAIERVKLFAVSSSIRFYMKLGVDFWGVNTIGQYYSDFPMPQSLEDIPYQMLHPSLEGLLPKRLDEIYAKLQSNGSAFEGKALVTFNLAKEQMQKRYRFEELKKMVEGGRYIF